MRHIILAVANTFPFYPNVFTYNISHQTVEGYTYQTAFRDLYFSYYEVHPEQAPDFTVDTIPQVDFRYASQEFRSDDGSLYVLFPVVQNRVIIEILVGIVNEDFSEVSFYIAESDEFIDSAMTTFKDTFIDDGTGTYTSSDGDIDAVIISPPKNPKQPKMVLFGSINLEPAPCEAYNGCGGGGAGGGGTFIPLTPPLDPCAKGKTVGTNADKKALLSDLKSKTTSSFAENAYLLNLDGTTPLQTGASGAAKMTLSLDQQINGFFHSHFPGILSIFSVGDLFSMASIYKKGNMANPNTFVMGVVTASGTQYLLVIDDLTKFNNFATNAIAPNGSFDQSYQYLYEHLYNNNGIAPENSIIANENGFVNFLEQSDFGLKVLKGDSTFSNWSTLVKNASGTIVPQPCP